MKHVLLMLLFGVTLHSQTQNYVVSSENFSNPERGQYHYTTSGIEIYNFLKLSTLTDYRVNEKITLVWREFSLNNFKTSPISSEYLANMQTDFNTMRSAGVKCIVRFCYTHIDGTDATKSQILSHIEQLKPVLLANEDVISSLEAGFIGNYGEWYYSNNFGTGTHTTQNIIDRKEVGLKIMELTPNRKVAFRTPTIQRQIGGATALTAQTAFDGSINSRVAAHNDCFLSSSSDYGTYVNTTTDYTYLENQSKYTFDGGETCSPTTYSECSNAIFTMNRFHFSYLNADYNQSVSTMWQTNGCYDEIKKRLGYRFELVNSTISNNILTLNIQNSGFANVINERKAYLVLRNSTTGAEYSFQINTDMRLWQRGTTTQIVQSLNLNVPQGTYQLFLNLPDSNINNPLYSIQCANVGTWDATKGYNNLNQTYTVASQQTIVSSPETAPIVVETTPIIPAETVNVAVAPVEIILENNKIIKVYNLPSPNFTIAVYSTSGRLRSTSVDISNLKRGTYIVKVMCESVQYSKKIYKK